MSHQIKEETIAPKLDYIQFIIIDLFCGAGGTTLGFEKIESKYDDMYRFLKSVGIDPPKEGEAFFKMAKVISCVNHDHLAIKSHWINNPEVEHFEEDIRVLDPSGRMRRLLDLYRAMYPHAKIILWASLECTNFSKAKGGMSRDADSRTLAEHLFKYIDALKPDYVQIENVVEFMLWGPMMPKIKKTAEGNYDYCPLIMTVEKREDCGVKWEEIMITPHWIPDPEHKGQDWVRWRNQVCDRGYHDDWRQMNSADFGAYTSRNRLFGVFAKDNLPISWPEKTHHKKPEKLSVPMKKWSPVKDVLDFDDEGNSIFNRKKPLSTKTYQRLYMGCIKHIAGGKDKFISRYNGGKPNTRNNSVDEPAAVVTTNNRLSLIKANFISKYNGVNGGKHHNSESIEEPIGTISTKERHAKICATFLSLYNSNKTEEKGGGNEGRSINQPAPTLTTGHTPIKVTATFIDQRNGTNPETRSSSVNEPTKTLTKTGGNQQLVQADFFIDKQYYGDNNHQSIDQPAGTILTNDKHKLIKAEKFVLNTNFDNIGSSIEEPAPTLTASRRHHYIVNPSWYGNSGSIEEPCFVVVARQDKAPLYLISCEEEFIAVPIYNDDCEWAIKLKEFMALYGIYDIKMRMLKEMELLPIQGFPIDYFEVVRKKGIKVSATNAKKYIGNAVHPRVPEEWIKSFHHKLTA